MKLIRHEYSSEILVENSKLKKLDNFHSVLALISDIGIWISISYISNYFWNQYGLVLYPITILVIGSKMRGLTALIHEYSHDTLAESKQVNDFIGYVSGILTFTSIQNYKLKHLSEHHPYLGDSEKDPDAMLKINLGIHQKMTKLEIWQKIIFYPFTVKYLYENTIAIFRGRFGAIYKGRNVELRKDYYLITSFLIAIFLICYVNGWTNFFLLYWFVPCFTTFQQFLWFTMLAEHYPLSTINSLDLEMSRNRQGNWLEQIILDNHGVSFHSIHHDNPKIPWWNLKKSFNLKLSDPKFYEIQKIYGGGILTKGILGAPNMFEQIFKYMV